ncbi:MAG: peptide-methionine (R)-S-oxide reductase MsrB [Halieaceae bacterium]|mgnify:CR=1 FL=1|jgi:peptide-methionine (R)-S-oxide reductase|nr:methionine sulfoxide reductase B [marine gamma proteobacterium HTCC2080]MBT3459220.1 peptide-methionine (R)-S-oxide reductase MsrB [Halieaceae bacterium]MDG1492745.1 peptide-methionine (R)-S-oxide reductase MsrB [Luminiphilus sp.]MBT4855255.1 peptide-methionine (R)-S-oxide reductase MsrB [Halieaceae bacterium]MBT5207971.1 peptide-methionine (R)-S-oxide reductase MsrB [Halieaceae bacterium]
MTNDENKLTEEQWRAQLTADEFTVLREKGTERAFSGEYWNIFEDGMYHCRGCGEALFESSSKFDAGCGWPSFDRAASADVVKEDRDMSHGMVRTEILCQKCGGHLGHVFPDGPTETGLRYCVNSLSVKLESPED